MKKIIIIGATSVIAQATARLFAAEGHRLFLVAREESRLAAVAQDLQTRGAQQVETFTLDALDYDRHGLMLDQAIQQLGGLDLVFIAYGTLPNQQACEMDFETARRELEINCLSILSLLTLFANRLESQGHGCIAVITSVAGDRGRQSNYVYGTAKGALNLFLQGLRNRLARSNVHVLTIKPGFVDTPMTTDFNKGLLWAQPADIAQGILLAIARKREVVYLPWFWRVIMGIICAIPEKLFKRLKL